MKNNETIAPEAMAELAVEEPVKDALQIGVKLTGSNATPDRFISCENHGRAWRLVADILEAHSAFVRFSDDGIVNIAHVAYAEVVEQ